MEFRFPIDIEIKNPIDMKLNAFDVSSNCVHNAEGSKDSHRRVNLMNFHDLFFGDFYLQYSLMCMVS